MPRRLFATATTAALLALYLGLPCLALARAHEAMSMDDPAAAPCEAGETAATELLCQAPGELGSPSAAASVPTPDEMAVAPHDPGLEVGPLSGENADDPSSPDRAPPDGPAAFLLHRSLLI